MCMGWLLWSVKCQMSELDVECDVLVVGDEWGVDRRSPCRSVVFEVGMVEYGVEDDGAVERKRGPSWRAF